MSFEKILDMLKKLTLVFIGISFVSLMYSQSAGTQSSGDYLFSLPAHDRDVYFSTTESGKSLPIFWGLDTAWPSEENIRRGIAFMGQVDVVRVSFQPTYPLLNGDLQTDQINWLNTRLGYVDLTGPNTKVALNSDHPWVDNYYLGNAVNWANLIDVTARRVQEKGRTVISVSPFNEPDYGWGQGTITDFYNIAGELKNKARFNNIRISGGNTLNCDQALPWYNTLKDRLDEGNTHQLAGGFDSYASFFQTVRANGDYATADELHNVMEAMVGVEYGMQSGIWWGTAELARGEFCKASDGVRLGYAEHRPNWTAASVYRAPDGKIQAFGGTSERQAVTTSYRFVSKDRNVFYNGYGPQREYSMVLPGGTGYQVGQTNAERVVDVTWGEDIQPVIDGQYVLVNRKSKMVIEVPYGSTGTGSNLWQRKYNGYDYQHWNVKPVDSRVGGDFSYFTFTASHSGKSFDLLNYSLSNGAGVVVWDDIKSGNQQWYLDYIEDGWFYIRSRHSAKCLEVMNGLTIEGAKIQQYDVDGDPNQHWRFIPVGAPVEFESPNAPAELSAIINAESIQLNWEANSESDLKGYTVYRADSINGIFSTIARNVITNSFVDNQIVAKRQYYYKIRAFDNSLNRSEYSDTIIAQASGVKDLLTELDFEKNLRDTSVNLNHASSYGTLTYSTGKTGSNSVLLNGTNSFIQLSPVIANHNEITVSTWVLLMGAANWMRIFDFGNGTDQYMYLTSRSGNSQLRFAIKNGGEEQSLNAAPLPVVKWTHVAVTLGANGATMYVNGVKVDSSTSLTIRPDDFKPVLNYIGKSQFASDPLLKSYIDDFRVYNYELSADEIARLAGVLIDGIVPVELTETFQITITDIQGRLIHQAKVKSQDEINQLYSNLDNGIFIIKESNSISTNYRKIIKQ